MPRIRRNHRPGYALVMFALFLVGLMALACIVVDLGMARLSQSEMQSASDAAALEGLRNRDESSGEPDRTGAADLVLNRFDDDLDPTNGDPLQVGAGPVFDLTQTAGVSDIGELNAGQLIHFQPNPEDRVYKPALQPNAADQIEGDIVSGNYDLTAADHGEASDYTRMDFTPYSTDASLPRNALLVRIRRSRDDQTIDREADVSSSGPTVPYLFGIGTFIHGAPGSGRQPKREGITVRSTSIARAIPARSIGPMLVTADVAIDGLTPFALDRGYWQTMGTDVVSLAADSTGALSNPAGSPVGQLIAATSFVSVGRGLSELAVATPPTLTADQMTHSIYVPVYDTVDGVSWIVGFGRVTITSTSPLQIQRQAGGLAKVNATAALVQSGSAAIPVGAPIDVLLATNGSLDAAAASSGLIVTAPAIVR